MAPRTGTRRGGSGIGFVGMPALLAMLGCGGPSRSPPTPSLFEDPAIPLWEIGPEPEYRLGGKDEREGYFFDGVRGATLVSGRLAVADGGSHEIRFFDVYGSLVSRTGRAGTGPGEYRSIGGLAPVGDTALVVWDQQLRRCTFLLPSGETIRTVNPDLRGAKEILPAFVGAMPGGELIFRDAVPAMALRYEVSGERRDSAVLLLLGPDGAWGGHSRPVPGTETTFVNEGNSWGGEPVIFGRSTFQAIAGDRLIVASNDSLEFMQLDLSLRTRLTANFPWRPRAVLPADVEAERQDRHREARALSVRNPTRSFINGRPLGEAALPAEERRIEAVAARNTEPAFSELRGGVEGDTWVAEFAGRGATARWWLVLDPTLNPIARVRISTELQILVVSRDLILGYSPAHSMCRGELFAAA